jgi:hypothetical protein
MENVSQIAVQLCFVNGDIKTEKWLMECKTCMTQKQSFNIKKEWLDKLKQESFAMNKEFYALVFNFGIENEENYYVLSEKIFIQILSLLEEMENER